MLNSYEDLSVKMTLDPDLSTEAKALVALAFRNGPIEALHAGAPCPMCNGKTDVSHISDEQMKEIMKAAVDSLYRLLWQKKHDPERWRRNLALGKQYTMHWDDPDVKDVASWVSQ